MKEQIYWFEEVCLKLNISREKLYNFLVDSGFCFYKKNYDKPIAYKRFCKPLKLRKKPEHGYFILRKDNDGNKMTFVTKSGLKFIENHINDVEFIFTKSENES